MTYSLAERGGIQARTAELQQMAALYEALGGGRRVTLVSAPPGIRA